MDETGGEEFWFREMQGWGVGWGDKVVCGQSQQREVTICSVVFLYLFVCLGAGVERDTKYQSNRSNVTWRLCLR